MSQWSGAFLGGVNSGVNLGNSIVGGGLALARFRRQGEMQALAEANEANAQRFFTDQYVKRFGGAPTQLGPGGPASMGPEGAMPTPEQAATPVFAQLPSHMQQRFLSDYDTAQDREAVNNFRREQALRSEMNWEAVYANLEKQGLGAIADIARAQVGSDGSIDATTSRAMHYGIGSVPMPGSTNPLEMQKAESIAQMREVVSQRAVVEQKLDLLGAAAKTMIETGSYNDPRVLQNEAMGPVAKQVGELLGEHERLTLLEGQLRAQADRFGANLPVDNPVGLNPGAFTQTPGGQPSPQASGRFESVQGSPAFMAQQALAAQETQQAPAATQNPPATPNAVQAAQAAPQPPTNAASPEGQASLADVIRSANPGTPSMQAGADQVSSQMSAERSRRALIQEYAQRFPWATDEEIVAAADAEMRRRR